MASQKGGGLGLIIGLAVSIFLVIILVVAVFMQQSTIDAEKRKATDAESRAEDVRKKERGYVAEIQSLRKLIHGSGEPVDVKSTETTLLKEGGKNIAEVLNKEEWFGEEFAKGLTNKDGVKLASRDYTNLKQMYEDVFVAMNAVVSQLNLLRTKKAEALADVETERSKGQKAVGELEGKISSLNKEKSDLVNKQIADATAAEAEKRRLMDEKQAILDEKLKNEDTAAINEAKLRSELSGLQGRIAELTEKKKRTLAETEADGEVVHADQKLGLAWVNLGQEERVRRGTAFEVFQYVKGGARKIKGHIEIRAIDDHTSQVAILDQVDASDPIVKGDLIASPFFDKAKTMHFVFVGDKLTNDRYSKDELIRRIEEAGGKVDPAVTINTDFVVAVENAEQYDEFQKAVQFGVTFMREPELLEFLGR